jgi:hypothetical protein
MKCSALLVAASVATASAFAPSTRSAPSSTQLNESLFKKISNLDLWAPVANSNDYGARSNKKIVTGKLTEKSYIPTGLTKAQYEKIRAEADKKKAANYQKNVAKAGVFTDYTDFYLKRGTAENGSWMKLPNLGHRMAKTKYDWSGETVRRLYCHFLLEFLLCPVIDSSLLICTHRGKTRKVKSLRGPVLRQVTPRLVQRRVPRR